MALTHETKPKIKNNKPMMRIEIKVSRLVNELASIAAAILLMGFKFS